MISVNDSTAHFVYPFSKHGVESNINAVISRVNRQGMLQLYAVKDGDTAAAVGFD